ncbi:unnamed protein product, partial [Allacma fusca]
YVQMESDTDVFINFVFLTFACIVTNVYRVAVIIFRDYWLESWRLTCTKISKVSSYQSFSLLPSEKYTYVFNETIGKETKTSIRKIISIWLLMMIVSFFSTFFGKLPATISTKEIEDKPSTFGILATIVLWTTVTILHNAICIWYNFIQNLYASYFMVVALELKEINGKWNTYIKQDLETNLNDCLQVFSIMEELVLMFNQDYSVGMIIDIGYSFISSVVFSFFCCIFARDGKSEQCYGMITLLVVVASRIYFFANSGLRVNLNVDAVRKELLLIEDNFDSQTLFKVSDAIGFEGIFRPAFGSSRMLLQIG